MNDEVKQDQNQEDNKEQAHIDIAEYNDLKAKSEKQSEIIKKYRGYEANYKQFSDLGLSADEVKEMVAERNKAKEKEQLERGEFEKVKQQIIESNNIKYSDLQKQYDDLYNNFSAVKVGDNLKSELVKAGATNTGVELLSKLLQPRAKLDNIDGKYVVKVFDSEGQPMANDKGDATLADLVESVKSQYGELFNSNVKAGSGKQPNNGGMPDNQQKQLSRSDFDAMTPADRMAKIKNGYKVI